MNAETYKNRYGSIYTFTPDKDKNVIWEGDFDYHRYSYDDNNNITMVDPSGGPYLSVGMKSTFAHSKIKNKLIIGFERLENGYKILIK